MSEPAALTRVPSIHECWLFSALGDSRPDSCPVESKAGWRSVGLPPPLPSALRARREASPPYLASLPKQQLRPPPFRGCSPPHWRSHGLLLPPPNPLLSRTSVALSGRCATVCVLHWLLHLRLRPQVQSCHRIGSARASYPGQLCSSKAIRPAPLTSLEIGDHAHSKPVQNVTLHTRPNVALSTHRIDLTCKPIFLLTCACP